MSACGRWLRGGGVRERGRRRRKRGGVHRVGHILYLYIYGVGKGGLRRVRRRGGVGPDAEEKTGDGGSGNGHQPCRDGEAAMALPGTYVQLLVLLVAQPVGHLGDDLVIGFHIS